MFDGEYDLEASASSLENSSLERVRKLIDKLEEELEECEECEITLNKDCCYSIIDELKKELEDE
jgi:hypothetical protein